MNSALQQTGRTWWPRAVVLVLLLVVTVTLVAVSPTPAQAVRFDDVPPRDVFVTDIDRLAAVGITRGCNPPANDRFCPDDPVTREQMAAFLTRALDLPDGVEQFVDVGLDDVFAADIAAINRAGITRGCNPPANDRFCPDLPVTREQMAAFLTRGLDLPDAGEQFRDVSSGNVFASEIGALAAAGITKGCDPPANDRFCPDDLVTRGQMAAFLVRAGLAPHPARSVPGLQLGATPFSQDGSPDATARIAADPGTSRAAVPGDEDDPEPVFGTAVTFATDVIPVDATSTYVCREYSGRGFAVHATDSYLFTARFDDGTEVVVSGDPAYGSRSAAAAAIEPVLRPLGQLPTLLRRDIGAVSITPGPGRANAAADRGIRLFEDALRDSREAGTDQELLFHEAVHTSLPDLDRQRSQAWLDAQVADGRWLTTYGRQNPDTEDVAETAITSFGLLHHRDRLPDVMEQAVLARVPNRTGLLSLLFPPDQPIFSRRDANPACS